MVNPAMPSSNSSAADASRISSRTSAAGRRPRPRRGGSVIGVSFGNICTERTLDDYMDATYTKKEIEMTDRVAIVTGASGGIGHAVAVRLGEAGMAVAVHYSGNRDRAQAVADEITAAGGRAVVVGADIADETQVIALFDAVEAEFGGIDVVVNTAGIMLLSPLTELNLDDFDRM